MEYRDYYKVLGVNRTDSQDEIKSAYRKLAMKYHPDHNPDNKQAEEKFKDLNEAYQVLGTEENRKKYDQLGSSYQNWQQTGGRSDFNWQDWVNQRQGAGRQNYTQYQSDGAEFGQFSDFFTRIFGAGFGMPNTGGDPFGRSIRRNHLSPYLAARSEIHLNLSGAFNYMMICYDVALFVVDKTAARARPIIGENEDIDHSRANLLIDI